MSEEESGAEKPKHKTKGEGGFGLNAEDDVHQHRAGTARREDWPSAAHGLGWV